MPRVALGCFEERCDKSWICTRATALKAPGGEVAVQSGQVFAPNTIFAGYRDFTGFLLSQSMETTGDRMSVDTAGATGTR